MEASLRKEDNFKLLLEYYHTSLTKFMAELGEDPEEYSFRFLESLYST